MLVKRLQRHLAIFLTAAMLLPCLPVYTAAAEENPENITETSETAPVPEEPAADEPAAEAADSAIIAYYQEKIDTILDTYLNVDGLPREEFKGRLASMTAEEVRAFVADMGFEYREALYDIMLMEEELGAQFDAEEISEQQISELLETDLVYSNFVDALWEKYAADKSISWLEATPIDGVSVTDSLGNATLSTDGTKVTITAGGAAYTYGTPETNNITITNENTYSATISFDYSIDRYSAFSESPNYSGTKTQLLASGESITMSITGARNTLSSRRTATLTLSNFSCVRAAESSDVTIQFENGTVTADGSSVPTGTVISATLTSGVALAATPSSGMTFLGWIDAETHEIVSDTASFTHYPSKNITLQPVFASAATDAWFSVDNNTIISLYDDLNEAGAAAANASSKTAVLRHDGTLPSGNYTIPAGVTLLIPFDAAHTLCTTKPQTDAANSLTKPTPYRTLKMAADANITVNGAISVSGTQHSKMALGTPFGPVGYIDMASGSSITVNNGGNLYVWGFIAGSGAVTVKSGGTVYESFQVSDWRGGSATLAMQDNNEKIFPVTQYHVQNVEVPMTLEAGAYEKGFMSVNVTLAGIQTTTIDFVGPDSLFIINSGSITKDYDEATDRLIIDLNNCTLNINTVTISVRVQLVGSVTLQSSKYILPISSNITVNVNSGSSVNLSQDMAFLPGTELNIAQGATCSVTGDASIIFYDVDNWGKYCGASNLEMTYVSAVSSGTRASRATLADAAIKVNGTLDASNGYLYTTAAGGNIYSTGTGQVIQRAGTQTVTYQATYVEDGYTANPITITPAKLKNEDGKTPAFTDTSTATEATTYSYIDGVWQNCKRLDIVATNIAVNAGLDMWFYVKKADVVANGSPNYNAVITKVFADDRTDNPVIVTIPDDDWVAHTDNGVEYLRFCFSDISAKEMTDNITAVIYQADDNVQVSNTYVQTVQKYAIETLDAYKGKTDQKSEYLKKALMDMLEYGASAQAQFKNYNIDLPANIAPEGVTTLTDHAKYITTNDQDPKWEDVKDYEDSTHTVAGVTASATNTLMFTFYFDISLPAEQAFPNMYAVYEYTPHVVPGQSAEAVSKRVEGENFYDRIPQSLYGVDITTLSIIDGHQPITCTLYNADGSVAAVATDSIGGYAMRNKDNGAIFRDMMQFVDSAQAYFDYQS